MFSLSCVRIHLGNTYCGAITFRSVVQWYRLRTFTGRYLIKHSVLFICEPLLASDTKYKHLCLSKHIKALGLFTLVLSTLVRSLNGYLHFACTKENQIPIKVVRKKNNTKLNKFLNALP